MLNLKEMQWSQDRTIILKPAAPSHLWIPDMPVADILPFLLAWIRNPLRVAAVAPSGAAVAALMTQEITAETGPVIELGPGTGPFTYSLLDRGVRETDLTLIEYGSDFIRLLQVRFPRARVLCMDAAWLDKYKLFENATVGAVISGLGLLTMSPHKITAILSGAFGYLRLDGAFYQITYGPRCPIADTILDGLDLQAARIGQTLRNVPPASVYRITRRKPTVS
jgi:phosphatidylethanolamine/phosphatidyl-N-methylethanolamine N-methyltransferase